MNTLRLNQIITRFLPCFRSIRHRFALFSSTQYIFMISCFFLSLFLLSATLHLTGFVAIAEEIASTIETKTGKNFTNKTQQNINNIQLEKEDSLNKKNGQETNVDSSKSIKDTQYIKAKNPELPNTNSTTQNAFGWKKYFQAVGIMLFLLFVLWYVLKIVRKYGNGRFLPIQKLLPKDAMYIEGQLSVGPNKCIAIVKVLDKRLVLGITEKNITLLTEMVDNEELEHTKSFHEHIQNAATTDVSSPSRPHSPTP